MVKEITLCLPKYVVKFILSENDYIDLGHKTLKTIRVIDEERTHVEMKTRVIKVPRLTEIGHLIHGFSRTIPYNQKFDELSTGKNLELISFQYNCKKKAFDVPAERYQALSAFLVELFRSSLIREVSAIHTMHSEEDYGSMVRFFLDRRDIIVDDSQDKDIEWETAKKIYRDHLERISRKNAQKPRLSKPTLSVLQQVCPA